ncbi:TetR family transcriptional regulator [Streptomyces koyangensis]|uniref:TetR family transcriptional regulator n=1 Tax=Streptomyces koyangensis TaxID=188770 RepID=UPI003454A2F1
MTSRPDLSLAQRKRQLVADELTEAALQLLALRGFDGVTVDEIVAAAGVSKRTFFRYFASKEDVVVQFLADMGTDMCAELASRPAGEPPSTALLRTVLIPLTTCGARSEKALPLVRLILSTPALRARFLERQAQWREGLSTELGRRLGLDAATDLYPHLAAGMALTAFDTVLLRWTESEGADDPAELAERAFAVIGASLDSVA